jgi:hypothetical protein
MANEQSNRVTKAATIAGLTMGGTVQTVLADGAVTFSKTIATLTDAHIAINLDTTTVQLMAIEADNDCDVYTNAIHSGSYDDHLVLKARQPLIWATGDPAGLKFMTGDDSLHIITAFYVTTTTATLLKFGAAVDSTPVLSP